MELVVIAFFVLAFVGVAVAVYSRSGTDVSAHPIGEEHTGGAPGAAGPSEVSGRDEGEHETFEQHGTR